MLSIGQWRKTSTRPLFVQKRLFTEIKYIRHFPSKKLVWGWILSLLGQKCCCSTPLWLLKLDFQPLLAEFQPIRGRPWSLVNIFCWGRTSEIVGRGDLQRSSAGRQHRPHLRTKRDDPRLLDPCPPRQTPLQQQRSNRTIPWTNIAPVLFDWLVRPSQQITDSKRPIGAMILVDGHKY